MVGILVGLRVLFKYKLCFLQFALPRPLSWERLPQVSLPSIWTHSSSFFRETSLRLHTTPSCASSPYLGSCEHQRENWTQSELHFTPITYFMTRAQLVNKNCMRLLFPRRNLVFFSAQPQSGTESGLSFRQFATSNWDRYDEFNQERSNRIKDKNQKSYSHFQGYVFQVYLRTALKVTGENLMQK